MNHPTHKHSCSVIEPIDKKVFNGITSRETDSLEIVKHYSNGRSAPVLRLNIEISSDMPGEGYPELMAEWFSDLKDKISDLFEMSNENEKTTQRGNRIHD
jgi:hypothetical protein